MIIGITGKKQSGKDTVAKIIQYLITGGDNNYVESEGLSKIEGFIKYYDDGIDKYPYKTVRFADKLKDMVCLLIGCTREQLENEEFKNTPLGDEWDKYSIPGQGVQTKPFTVAGQQSYIHEMTPRLLLQLLGTDCGRNIIHPNIWVNSTIVNYHTSYFEYGTVKYILQDDGHYSLQGHEMESSMSESDMVGLKATKVHQCNWIIPDVRFPNEVKAIEDRKGLIIKVVRLSMVNNDEHESETALDSHQFKHTIHNDGNIEDLVGAVKRLLTNENIL